MKNEKKNWFDLILIIPTFVYQATVSNQKVEKISTVKGVYSSRGLHRGIK